MERFDLSWFFHTFVEMLWFGCWGQPLSWGQPCSGSVGNAQPLCQCQINAHCLDENDLENIALCVDFL